MTDYQGRRRQPRGVLSPQPVLFRLMPEERQMLEILAARTNCTLSRTASAVFRQGLGPYHDKVMGSAAQAPATPVEDR